MFWGIEAAIFIPCVLLMGATFIMFAYHGILYFQYKERIIWKYCFYLGAITIYLLLDLYARSDLRPAARSQTDAIASAANFIVILGYSSFLMEAVYEFRPKFKMIFFLWSVTYYITITYIVFLIAAGFLSWNIPLKEMSISNNIFRLFFVVIAVVAIICFFPLVKGRFMNLVKWGGMVYLFFMLVVLATVFLPGKQFLGLAPMHWAYIGTFADVLIFSFAMSLKIKESLNKTAELRQNLSRDLHDEVGATLTGIRVFGQLAKERPETQAVNLEKINNYSEEMLNKMSDIVWAINPDNDSIDRMISKLHSYAAAITSAKDIQLEFIVDDNIRRKSLDMNLRKNLYLFSKEAINNAVKYSACKNIRLHLSTGSNTGTLKIKDDGIGFDKSNNTNGNGLNNMKNRAAEVRGKLEIATEPGKGTAIELNFNFT